MNNYTLYSRLAKLRRHKAKILEFEKTIEKHIIEDMNSRNTCGLVLAGIGTFTINNHNLTSANDRGIKIVTPILDFKPDKLADTKGGNGYE